MKKARINVHAIQFMNLLYTVMISYKTMTVRHQQLPTILISIHSLLS